MGFLVAVFKFEKKNFNKSGLGKKNSKDAFSNFKLIFFLKKNWSSKVFLEVAKYFLSCKFISMVKIFYNVLTILTKLPHTSRLNGYAWDTQNCNS